MIRALVFIYAMLSTSLVVAQVGYSVVPLQKEIEVHLLGSDKQVLQCYNLYGYNYITATDSLYGEFIVKKDADTFHGKQDVRLKFCRIKECSLQGPDGKCRAITIDGGIELTYQGQTEKVYLNFDPSLPDAVFMPCK